MARKPLKPSEKLVGWTLLLSLVLTVPLAIAARFPWWLGLIAWLVVWVSGYQTLLRMTADERITDRDHDPDKPAS